MRPRRSHAPDSAQHHRDWLSLVEVSGPFLSLPVLRAAWPTLDALDKPAREKLRLAHSAWQDNTMTGQRAWIDYILGELLEWADALRWAEGGDLDALSMDVPEHDTRVTPGFVLVEPGEDATQVLGMICEPGTPPSARIKGETWAATPVDRLAQLCRHHEVELGLATDGRWWALVWAPRGRVTTTATFDAIGWSDAAERDVVRAFMSLLRRNRFFGVPDEDKLVALLRKSEDSQEEITEALGVQVRQAVELLVAAIGRADTARRDRGEPGLSGVDAQQIYRGAVSVMMRIVFLLFAEERKMLPSDNDIYATSYSVGQLCAALERRSLESSEDDLEHGFAAWHRLLALFDAVYFGIDHPRLWMYPHDGSLFDRTTFPWLPRNIDDRTVLNMLRAVQYVEIGTGSSRERRKLSFRELDVEQIGYVYEGLLSYDGFRAEDVVVSLVGKRGLEQEVKLRELEDLAVGCRDIPALAATVAGQFRDPGIGSARTLEKRLAPLVGVERESARRKLLAVTRGDAVLSDRLLPFFGIIRQDLREQPVVIMPGELFVTESPLRGLTGTHYTPRHLAEMVVKDALEPLVYSPGPLQTANRDEWKPRSSEQILRLKIVDIAMGSGAFLVSAARYLAERLVEAWVHEGDERALHSTIARLIGEGDGDDDPVLVQARRAVIEHCLYGVDINPAAVEMAKVSLWLISMDRERPLTFLDDRLVTGDSLLGITSREQLRHMHIDPAKGRDIHTDLFAWTESTDNLLEKVADTERRIAELPLVGHPLDWLDDKRKLVKECHDDTAQLRLLADLLVGSLLANASDGQSGVTRASVEAARWAEAVVRNGEEESAREQALTWLRTDMPSVGFPRKPLHWPLVFVDVFQSGGFDAVVGNKPYLGGQKLTGALGRAYREYLIHAIGNSVRGSADLIAYFVLRAHALLKPTGQAGLIATNTLAQGDTREVGLDQVVAGGATIRKSIKSRPWPSKSAELEYCTVWTSRSEVDPMANRVADDVAVSGISSSLDAESRVSGHPARLASNGGISYQGSNILGLGFTMEPDEAKALIAQDARNAEVLFPYLNGQDLNSRPDCSASRWVINFHEWPEDRAKRYEACYDRLRRLVKPERDKNKRRPRRERWWQYAERTPELVAAIAGLNRVIVMAQVSKTVMPVMVPTGQVFSHKLVIFATDDTAMLALLSSAPHYWWTIRRSSTMKTDISYSPTDVLQTIPLPELVEALRRLGDRLDTFRRGVMRSRDSGLTKTYNLVFDPACTDQDIEELRRIHRTIDEATIRAYGWEDRIAAVGGLDHGFHKVGRETRYTIGPAAQREILDNLLELNHERYAEEVAQGLHDKKSSRKRRSDEGALF